MTTKLWGITEWQIGDTDFLTENGIENSIDTETITVDSYGRKFEIVGKSILMVTTHSDEQEVLVRLKFSSRLLFW